MISYEYTQLGAWDGLLLYTLLVAVSAATGWVYYYGFGQILLHRFFGRAAETHPLKVPLAIFAGMWAFPTLALLLGHLGLFKLYLLLPLAGAILLVAAKLRLGLVPGRGLQELFRRETYATAFCLITAVLIAGIGVSHLAPWFDGNFTIAAGHLARTGTYLADRSDGQSGMASLVAMVNIFFPRMSPVTAAIGWGPFYGPFLFLGMFLLLRELFGKGRWEALAIVFFAFPTALKTHEIRASCTGFGLVLWSLLFLLRHFRTKNRLDFAGAVLTLAASWNFGQFGSVFFFVFAGVWSVGAYLGGNIERAQVLWRLLLWTNVLEWAHLISSFRWSMGAGAPLWKVMLPGSATLVAAFAMVRILPRLPRAPAWLRAHRAPRLAAFAGVALAAWWMSPRSAPAYNWVFFDAPVWFGEFNFTSYGAWGWVFLLSLVLALPDASSPQPRQSAWILWHGFAVSCLIQILAQALVQRGASWPFGEAVIAWDLWKDAPLHWNNPFMVIGAAYLLERLASAWKMAHSVLAPRRVQAGAIFAMLLCLQRTEPYRVLLNSSVSFRERVRKAFIASLSERVEGQWKGQQSYSFPMYIAYALLEVYRLGEAVRRKDCALCTVQTYGFLRKSWPIFDFLSQAELEPGETFVAANSISTHEVYLNRQIRYSLGPNTVCPIYIGYMDRATAYLPFWQDKMRIRRNKRGSFYSVTEPARNLQWLRTRVAQNGNLEATVSVPRTGEYEIYLGYDMSPVPAHASIDGVPLQAQESPALGWAALEPGRAYMLTLAPLPGQAQLSPEVPIVLYPRRAWHLEKYFLDEVYLKDWYSALSVMRFTGVPSADITVEELEVLMKSADATAQNLVLDRHKVRYVILDDVLQDAFPGSIERLRRNPRLQLVQVNGRPVFEVKRR